MVLGCKSDSFSQDIIGVRILKKDIFFSDNELIARSKKGDKQAFGMLFEKYHERILGYLYRYIGDFQLAEDSTVKVFLSVYRNISNYTEQGLFLHWLYRISTNEAKNQLKANSRKKEVSIDAPAKFDARKTLADIMPDERSRPDDIVATKELKEIYYKIVGSFDKKYKDVLLLCDVEGLSNVDAAKVLGMNPLTVGTRLSRARKILHDIMKKYKI